MVATINFHDLLHLQPGVCHLTLGVGNEDLSDDLEQSILTFWMATLEYFLVMMQFIMASQRFIIMSKTFFGGKCVQNNLGVGVRPSFRSMPKISLIFLSKSVPKGWRFTCLRIIFLLPVTLPGGSCQYVTTLPTPKCIRRARSYCSICYTPQVNL